MFAFLPRFNEALFDRERHAENDMADSNKSACHCSNFRDIIKEERGKKKLLLV